MDDVSLEMYLRKEFEKSFCFIYLPDNSEHEICLVDKLTLNQFFVKYIGFLEQWITWLIESGTLKNNLLSVSKEDSETEKLNFNTLQSHLSKLKLFNHTLELDYSIKVDPAETVKEQLDMSLISVSNLLKQNNQFLKEISK